MQLHVALTPRCLPSFLGSRGGVQVVSAFTPNGALVDPFLLFWGAQRFGSDFGAGLHNLAPRRSAPASSVSRCLIGLSVLPQISHLLSTAGSVDTWK